MSEKFSEKHLRAQKVAALKGRLLDDVENAIFINVQDMELAHLQTHSSESVMPYVEVLHKLGVLKNRLEHDEGLLMRCSFSDEQQDVIVYDVDCPLLFLISVEAYSNYSLLLISAFVNPHNVQK